MAKNSKPKARRRKPRIGKRVENTIETKGQARTLAIDYAISFLRLAAAQERVHLARKGLAPGRFHVEARVASALAGLPALKFLAATPPDGLLERDIDMAVAASARLICRAIPDGFRKHKQTMEFVAMERNLTEWRMGPDTTSKIGDDLPDADGLPPESPPVFASATQVRAEIGKRLGLCRNTVLRLATQTKRAKPTKQA